MHKARTKTAKAETVIAYKAFDANLQCRGFQYEVGKTYHVPKGQHPVRCGAVGFHSCEAPFDVFGYYPVIGSRFAIVEASGEIARDGADTKIASAEITIKGELTLPEFIKRAAEWIVKAAKGNTATGYSGHAAATGDSGHAAATGDRGHAAATGDGGHAAATGDYGHATATGGSGHAAATGDRGHAAASGAYGHAAATGDRGHAAASGDYGHATATGDRGHAAATGYSGHAAVKGKHAIAISVGYAGTASAEAGGAIELAAYDDDLNLVAVFASMVGENGIEPGKTYRLGLNGKPELVEAA